MNTKKYTVITGASSGIGYAAAIAFAGRNKNMILTARRKKNLELLKDDILRTHPALDIIIKPSDLSQTSNIYQFYEDTKKYQIETWINNAGLGNYDSVANQNLKKIETMLHEFPSFRNYRTRRSKSGPSTIRRCRRCLNTGISV